MLQAILAFALFFLLGTIRIYIFGERPKIKASFFKLLLIIGLLIYAYVSAYLVIGLFI